MRHHTFGSALLSSLVLLAFAACGDDAAEDDGDTNATMTTGGNGGNPTTGGNGGNPTTGGNGGMPSTGGMGGTGGAGMGGDGGMGGAPNDAAYAYLWGDYVAQGTDALGRVGFPSGTVADIVPMGVTVIDELYEVAYSPDGTMVAVALRADSNAAQLFTMAADGTGAATEVASWAAAGTAIEDVGVSDVAWSPDGSRIAFVTDYSQNGANRVYVVPSDGSAVTPAIVSQDPAATNQDAYNVAWYDNTRVVYQGDLETNSEDNLFSSDVTLATAAPVALVPAGSVTDGAEVRSGGQIGSDNKIYFRSTHEGSFYLYRADVTGANLEQFPPAMALTDGVDQSEVGAIRISPDGTMVAFAAESADAFYQVYVAAVGATDATALTAVPVTAGDLYGPVGGSSDILWSPDAMRLAVVSDWPLGVGDLNNAFSLFVVPTSGGPMATRIAGMPADADLDARAVRWTSNERLIIAADFATEDEFQLYATNDLATADQDVTTLVVQTVPAGGEVRGIASSP